MERRRFTREFKVEAVKLVRERGVAVVEAALIARDHRAARSYEGLTRINLFALNVDVALPFERRHR